MSVQCSICHDTVIQPNSLWYAAMSSHGFVCYVCGDCLSQIPKEDRVPTNIQSDREVTFGPVRADVNSTGKYQMSGAKQMEPRFLVVFEVLEHYYASPCEFMTVFFPIARMERCLLEMLDADRKGIWPPWPWEIRYREHLLMECSHEIRGFLGLPKNEDGEEAPLFSLNGSRSTLKPGHVRLVERLWKAILEWGKARSTGPDLRTGIE